jgi:hypothetical protein
MFGDGSLTFREFAMREPLPLATIHDAILEFLRGRTDAVLFGAQAVNAYVDEPRMTQDVDILSPRAPELADRVQVIAPPDLIAQKVLSVVSRPKTAKGLTDLADIRRLLLTFPDLKSVEGRVTQSLRDLGASPAAHDAWRDIATQEIVPEDDEAGY